VTDAPPPFTMTGPSSVASHGDLIERMWQNGGCTGASDRSSRLSRHRQKAPRPFRVGLSWCGAIGTRPDDRNGPHRLSDEAQTASSGGRGAFFMASQKPPNDRTPMITLVTASDRASWLSPPIA